MGVRLLNILTFSIILYSLFHYALIKNGKINIGILSLTTFILSVAGTFILAPRLGLSFLPDITKHKELIEYFYLK